MFPIFYSVLGSFRVWFRSRVKIQWEVVALRHQLAVSHRQNPNPRLNAADRCFWVWLSRAWTEWRSVLLIVKPDTVVAWHRRGFRWYWTWKVRHGQFGRPGVPKTTRDLIRTISQDNPLWGAPRIHGELQKLGIDISQASVARFMIRHPKPPSPTWRAFLSNHALQMVSVDFFTVPTISFHVLYVFIVLAHDRRRILHFNVTAHPTAKWAAQQIVEAFPFDRAPRYLIRDNDQIYGWDFHEQLEAMGIREVPTAPGPPWQNAFVERVIGSIRRECLDHIIVFHEDSLRRVLRSYIGYYNESRLHLSLNKDSPAPRGIQSAGDVIAIPQVGGLHHRYERRAA